MDFPLVPDLRYGPLDADTAMFFRYFRAEPGATVLEVGANEEFACRTLADNGFRVTGVDLRPHHEFLPHNYERWECDFVGDFAPKQPAGCFDIAFSLSALEHFGLGGYGFFEEDPDLDQKAVIQIHRLLRPGGMFYVTVPYGRAFEVHGKDWRVYDRASLSLRLLWGMEVVEKHFFKSAESPTVPDQGGPIPLVKEEDADQGPVYPPHVTVLVIARKVT